MLTRPTYVLKEDNLKTKESSGILRYLLDRAEVQNEIYTIYSELKKRLKEIPDPDIHSGTFRMVAYEIETMIKELAQRDKLLSKPAISELKEVLQKYASLISISEKIFKKETTEISWREVNNNLFALLKEIKLKNNSLRRETSIFPFINYAQIEAGKTYPISLKIDDKYFENVEIRDLNFLCRKRATGKRGAVFEVTKNKPIGKGSFAEVTPLVYKIKKLGNHLTQVTEYGVNTALSYVDKKTNLPLGELGFEREEELISSLPHMHGKPGMRNANVGHIFLRDLPDRELFDALYTKGKEFQLGKQSRGDFIIHFAKQLLSAYQTQIENQNIIHRDIKPENIRIKMSTSNGKQILEEVNFIDFNLSEKKNRKTSHKGGTQLYLSPEALAGEHPTTSSDVYALGMVLFETITALTGDQKSATAVMDKTSRAIENFSTSTSNGLELAVKYKQSEFTQLLKKSLLRTDLEASDQILLLTLVQTMLAFNATSRPSPEDITETLSKLAFNRAQNAIKHTYFNHELSDVSKEIQSKLSSNAAELKQCEADLSDALAKKNTGFVIIENKINQLEQEKFLLLSKLSQAHHLYINDVLEKTPSHPCNKDLEHLTLAQKIAVDVRTLLKEIMQHSVEENLIRAGRPIYSSGEKHIQDRGIFKSINDISEIINKHIPTDIERTPEAFNLFVTSLGIKKFEGLTSKQQLIDTLNSIGDTLKYNMNSLQKLYDEVFMLKEATIPFDDKFDADIIESLKDEIEEVLVKDIKCSITVDNLVQLNEKFGKRIPFIIEKVTNISIRLKEMELAQEDLLKAKEALFNKLAPTKQKKSAFWEREFTTKEKTEHIQNIITLINNAKTRPELLKNIQDYIDKLPSGRFHALGLKQDMQDEINKLTGNLADLKNNPRL